MRNFQTGSETMNLPQRCLVLIVDQLSNYATVEIRGRISVFCPTAGQHPERKGAALFRAL
jgi:hypothetical protein